CHRHRAALTAGGTAASHGKQPAGSAARAAATAHALREDPARIDAGREQRAAVVHLDRATAAAAGGRASDRDDAAGGATRATAAAHALGEKGVRVDAAGAHDAIHGVGDARGAAAAARA